MVFLTLGTHEPFFEKCFFLFFSFFFAFSVFLRPGITTFVGSATLFVDTIIFSDVFIHARNPGTTVTWQELIAGTPCSIPATLARGILLFLLLQATSESEDTVCWPSYASHLFLT